MAFFIDLSPHTYSSNCGPENLNIGWLDDGNSFPTGAAAPRFETALAKLCEFPISLHKGVHQCWFCLQLHRIVEGNGQIRVEGKSGLWYVAPTMVHHYVTHHEYLPPREFVVAVLEAAIRFPRWPIDSQGFTKSFFG